MSMRTAAEIRLRDKFILLKEVELRRVCKALSPGDEFFNGLKEYLDARLDNVESKIEDRVESSRRRGWGGGD